MCGINGIFAYNPASVLPTDQELLATRDAMQARGPDGAGIWWDSDRRCGLAHRRLSILDLSERGLQPMTTRDGELTIIFNGEIYNYPELRAELEADGVIFASCCDTEVLLHLYSRIGNMLVHRIRGMYAFAIWDARRKGLFLARDPFGIKPLYTSNDGWTFRFASQVKALLAGGNIAYTPEPAGIVGFHLFGYVPEPFTLYRDIRTLPAGHMQWVDGAGPRSPKPFANLAEVFRTHTDVTYPARALEEHVRTCLVDSVRAHLLSDVEVGLFLSAGVDSGALLGLVRDAGRRQVRTITLAFDDFRDTSNDEAPLASLVSRCYGAPHILRRVTKREFLEDLPKILEAMDQPSIDGVNVWFVAKAAHENGIKVALSGLGGDEIFAGYSSFVDVPFLRRWNRLPSSVPGLGVTVRAITGGLLGSLFRNRPKIVGLVEHAGSWGGAYLVRRGVYLPHELRGVIDHEIAREGLRRLQPIQRVSNALNPDPCSNMARVCVLESANYMRNQLLRDADWAGMAHSIEIRVPFVDYWLLKRLAPTVAHFDGGRGKQMLARSPSTPLPDAVIGRSKTGFRVPTSAWLSELMGTSSEREANHEREGLVSRRWLRTVSNVFCQRLNAGAKCA
jgi:asparagine synthase (glutamine-hydrolysing)